VKIGLAISEVASAEAELVHALAGVGERHRADHDVFHTTKTLAKLENAHIAALGAHAERYEASVERSEHDQPDSARPLQRVVAKGAELVARRPEPALLLLEDLRRIYLQASEVSIDWVILAQGAQAITDTDLLSSVSSCHDETLRTVKWSVYRIKTASPQILAT
jgi:hypothetical protein